MSMLSDPREKQHYVLQPKGKPLWSDGSASFGTKMLEKMGWTKGKGLGKNLSGSQDFIRVTYKQDIKGLGFDEKSDQWTDHEKQFSSLLNSLNSDKEVNLSMNKLEEHNDVKTNIKSNSLEENSKNSKARVHYKKFTKAKDISQYSEKDLATIFGKKSLQDSSTIQSDAKTEENNENSVHALPIITSKANIHEYFKRKMIEIQTLRKDKNEKDEDKNSKSKKRKYSDNNDTNPEVVQTIQNDDENQNEQKKKRKNKNDEGNKHKEISEIKKGVKIDEELLKEKIKRKKRFHNFLEQTETNIEETEECLLPNKVNGNDNYNETKSTENDIKFCPLDKQEFNSENLEISQNNVYEENKSKKKSRKIKSEEILNLDGDGKVHKKQKLKHIDSDLISKRRENNSHYELEIVEDIVVQGNEKLTLKEKKLKNKKNRNNFLKGTEGIEECLPQNKNDLEDRKLEEVDQVYEERCLNICENLKENNDESGEKGKKKKTKNKKNKSFEEIVNVETEKDICKNFKVSQNDVCENNKIKKKRNRKDKIFVETEKHLAEDITKKKVCKSIEADITTRKEIVNSDDALEINQDNVVECEKPKIKTKKKKIKDKESDSKNINKNKDLILNDKEKTSILENVKAVELVEPSQNKVYAMDANNIEIYEKSKNKMSSTKSKTEDKTEQDNFKKSVENEKELINKKSKILQKTVKNIKNEILNVKNKKLVMSVKIENPDSNIVKENNENDRFKHIELDTLTVTKYSAEKFRMTNLDGFRGSNLKLIQGYGLQENFEINVIETTNCSDFITKFWDIKVYDPSIRDKYKSEKSRENEYKQKVEKAREMNTKIPKRNVKYLKKKSHFTHALV